MSDEFAFKVVVVVGVRRIELEREKDKEVKRVVKDELVNIGDDEEEEDQQKWQLGYVEAIELAFSGLPLHGLKLHHSTRHES